MIGTIDLYSLALTPNDTMFFDSVNEQTQWFDNQQHLSIENISFNGAKAFQLGNNYLDIIFQYNYVRYQLNNKYIYAFIENVEYVGDECCKLNISVDLNQTFLSELQTAIATSNIGNVTKKDNYFNNDFIPYSNKLSVPFYKSQNIDNLLAPVLINDNVYYLGYIMINIDPVNIGSQYRLEENGLLMHCCCIALPVFYNTVTKQLKTNIDCVCPIFYGGNDYDICNASNLQDILNKFGSYITDSCISITFNHLPILDNNYTASSPLMRPVEWDSNTNKLRFKVRNTFGALEYSLHDCVSIDNISKRLLIITKNVTVFRKELDLSSYIANIPEPIRREPYMFIRIGNDIEYITLNLAEFITPQGQIRNTKLILEYFNSCCYPFTTNFKFRYGNGIYRDRNSLFNLTTSITVPYSLSAWQQYFSTHSASINDGLATQQKYDREISKQNRDIATAQGGLNIVNSIANAGIGIASGIATLNPTKVISSAASGITGTGQGAMQIANAQVQYSNSELEREKQKALLEISWNDIKSSPSEYSNILSNITVFYANGIQGIEIDLYISANINDIIKYHKQYGYKVNRMELLNWQDIKQHTIFDYISFNTITIKSTLPQFYTTMIEQQYEQGVRFWYDYSKFMNYTIDNEERGG